MEQGRTFSLASGVAPALESSGVVRIETDLVLSDLATEGFLLSLRESPLKALQWLRGGRTSVPLPFDPAALRYDWDLVEALRQRRAAGDPLPIASSLPKAWQDAVLTHLGLSGEAEAAAGRPEPTTERSQPAHWLKALRLQQWAKNILIFIPLIMSHQLMAVEPLLNSGLAFICFGLVASTIYLMNDLMDLRQDRRHPSKRNRPFASGAIPAWQGLVAIPLLLAGAALLAARLPPAFWLVMCAYVVLNLGYTFYLKRKLLVDVIALSGAYTLRILAGNAAGPVELSNWLLAFSMFLFFSLALVKRYVELDTVGVDPADEKRVMGRGYRRSDLDMISQLGVASGFAAVVVLALFIEGAGKSGLYSNREVIWLVCPIILYVISRIWVLAKRRELPDDPIFFILTDWRSHLMGAIVAAIFLLAV